MKTICYKSRPVSEPKEDVACTIGVEMQAYYSQNQFIQLVNRTCTHLKYIPNRVFFGTYLFIMNGNETTMS